MKYSPFRFVSLSVSNLRHCFHLLGSVADIHNSMVDDGLVEKQKISGSNYFWSFPSKKDRMAQLEHQRTAQEVEELQQELEKSNAELADAKRGREDDDGSRPQKLARLGELAKERVKLEAELASLKANDPQALADLEKEVQFVTNGANRWTDNIFNVQSFLVKKKGMGKKEVVSVLFASLWKMKKCMVSHSNSCCNIRFLHTDGYRTA